MALSHMLKIFKSFQVLALCLSLLLPNMLQANEQVWDTQEGTKSETEFTIELIDSKVAAIFFFSFIAMAVTSWSCWRAGNVLDNQKILLEEVPGIQHATGTILNKQAEIFKRLATLELRIGEIATVLGVAVPGGGGDSEAKAQ